jgi:chlorobactene glucosyltransferase
MGIESVREERFLNAIWDQHALAVIVFLCFCLLTAYSNHRTVRRFGDYPRGAVFPRVSILVPARNEARCIEDCLQSLLNQDYPDFEVLVLDDHSTDETNAIVRRLARDDARLRVLTGESLPDGWLGKHWACHQLAEAATGELLLFTDADTRHEETALSEGVAALQGEKADLITAFPKEEVKSWGERLIVPVMSWGIFSFLPLRLAYKLSLPGLSLTIGQFMLFRRSTYKAIGGYEAVRQEIVDDVTLGRRAVEQGFRWRLLDATEHVHCRMYHNLSEVVGGFSKNVFAFFEYRFLPYVVAWSLLGVIFLEPAITLSAYLAGFTLTEFPPNLAGVAVVLSVLLWALALRRFRFPLYLAVLYPITISLWLLVVLRSLVLTMRGQTTWKGRDLVHPAMRWL